MILSEINPRLSPFLNSSFATGDLSKCLEKKAIAETDNQINTILNIADRVAPRSCSPTPDDKLILGKTLSIIDESKIIDKVIFVETINRILVKTGSRIYIQKTHYFRRRPLILNFPDGADCIRLILSPGNEEYNIYFQSRIARGKYHRLGTRDVSIE